MKGGEKDRVACTDKNGAAQRTKFAGILDVWSRRRCASRRYGLAYEHSAEQCSTVIHVDHFLLAFDRPKLKISYRNLKFGQIKVVEEEKIYNFCFERKLI